MISHKGAYSRLVRPAPHSGPAGTGSTARRRGLGLQFLDDGDRLPAVSFGDLPVVERLVRVDVLVHEGGELLLQFLDLWGIREVHPRIVTQSAGGCKGIKFVLLPEIPIVARIRVLSLFACHRYVLHSFPHSILIGSLGESRAK
jgi:hypothetical protein